MLDRVGAGTHRVLDARRTVGVDRDLVVLRVRGVDDRFHRLERHGLRRVDALVAAARAEDLDPVRPGRDPRLGLLAERLGLHGAAARGGEPLPGDEHARSDHPAHRNQIAHRVVDFVLRAKVANGGDAGLERAPRIVGGEHGRNSRGTARLAKRPRARRAVPVIRHVDVHVDHPGNDGEAPEIDHLCASRRCARADRNNSIVLDDDDRVRDRTGGCDGCAGADRLGLRQRRRREQGQGKHQGDAAAG